MATSPYLVYEGFLPNPEANIGSPLPGGSTYIIKEVLMKNIGAGVNRAQVGSGATIAAGPLVDENLPATGTAGNWIPLPLSEVYPAATQFRGLATVAAEVWVRVNAVRVT